MPTKKKTTRRTGRKAAPKRKSTKSRARKPRRKAASKLARGVKGRCGKACRPRLSSMGLGESRTRSIGSKKFEIIRVR